MSDGPTISVQVLLPEAIDRRFARRVDELEGASWPDWGGHITLVPNFVPHIEPKEVVARVTAVCADAEPFDLHLAEPTAHPDPTRPGYQAVFLTIPEAGDEDRERMERLRDRLMTALADVRQDVKPELAEQPFLPHVTLALSLGEAEATKIVQELRADGIRAEFRVDEVWVLVRPSGPDAKLTRTAVPLGSLPH